MKPAKSASDNFIDNALVILAASFSGTIRLSSSQAFFNWASLTPDIVFCNDFMSGILIPIFSISFLSSSLMLSFIISISFIIACNSFCVGGLSSDLFFFGVCAKTVTLKKRRLSVRMIFFIILSF